MVMSHESIHYRLLFSTKNEGCQQENNSLPFCLKAGLKKLRKLLRRNGMRVLSERKILLLFLFLSVVLGLPAESAEKNKMNGRTYYLSAPEKPVNPILLIWCHPSGGNAKPEFVWWKSAKITKQDVILLCPQSKKRTWTLKNDAAFVKKLITDIVKKYHVDEGKVILGGHSSGAVFTYSFGLKNQKAFRYIVPTCGILQKAPTRPNSKNFSIRIYHSTNDPVFSFKKAQAAKLGLEKLGYVVDLSQDKIGHSVGPKLVRLVRECIKEIRNKAKKSNSNNVTMKYNSDNIQLRQRRNCPVLTSLF